MNSWLIMIIGFLVGIVGISLGSIIGISIKKTDKILSFLMGISGGFMMFIVSFHLFPEAFYLGGNFIVIFGVTIGILIIIVLEILLEKLSSVISLKSGIILGLSIAIHSFPEGLALGSTLMTISDFSIVLIMSLLLHNILEGISMSILLSANRVKTWKIIFISILVGIPTGIGSFFGSELGAMSYTIIPVLLATAGAIMLYVVCNELIPTGKTLHKGRVSSIAAVVGFILGIILYF